MDIVEFLLARIREDLQKSGELLGRPLLSESERWYEERLLLEAQAKHAVVEVVGAARQAALASLLEYGDAVTGSTAQGLHWTDLVLKALTLPYKRHADYQPSWALP
jgi:hypothetical protein